MPAATTSLVSISCLIFLFHTFAAAFPNALPFKRSEPLGTSVHSLDLTRRYGHRSHGARLHNGVHTTPIFNRLRGSDYSFSILWGNRNLNVVIDTGSSDLCVASSNFTCQVRTGQITDQAHCGFGAYVEPNFQEGQIKDEVYDIEYGLPFIHGIVGYEDITLAGIEVRHQEVAIATKGFWDGDGVTAGLMGFGFPPLTSAFAKGSLHNGTLIVEKYFPWFFSAFRRGLIAPVFSLALLRSENDEHAGQFALGGLPKLDFAPEFTTVPIKTYPQYPEYPRPPFYRIDIDGWVVDDVFLPENGTRRTHLVDSGTPSILTSNHIAAEINKKYSPPGIFDLNHYQFQLPCNSTPPKVAVRIAGRDFFIDPRDLVEPVEQGNYKNQTGFCVSAFQKGYGADNLLGDAFLKNVVAVFDVGATEMRFAPHVY